MEYILIIIGCLITIVTLYFALGVNIRKIKETAKNEELNEIANRFPENEEICKSILKMLKNDKVKVKQNEEKENKSNGIGMVAAAIATGLGCIGAGIAVAVVASSAVGAISENPSLLGKTIIFAGLAEGIAIYGLIIAIMILNKV